MPQLLPGVSSGVSIILGQAPGGECTKDVHRSIEKNDGISFGSRGLRSSASRSNCKHLRRWTRHPRGCDNSNNDVLSSRSTEAPCALNGPLPRRNTCTMWRGRPGVSLRRQPSVARQFLLQPECCCSGRLCLPVPRRSRQLLPLWVRLRPAYDPWSSTLKRIRSTTPAKYPCGGCQTVPRSSLKTE